MTTGADHTQGENLVEEIRNDLVEIDAMEVNDHGDRYEQLHQKLSTALSSIDGL
ncbi:unannotated protein [freshwater metagenome]|jgi:ATP-dependent Clp protease adapter protein ClpS|uniref:Unannotated protein n=1 Tax=freshwater metagenome TaxID=449393 RepID=A0A6J6W5D4_9ZZZZ